MEENTKLEDNTSGEVQSENPADTVSTSPAVEPSATIEPATTGKVSLDDIVAQMEKAEEPVKVSLSTFRLLAEAGHIDNDGVVKKLLPSGKVLDIVG